MKKISGIISIAAACLTLFLTDSCTTSRDVHYFQDIETASITKVPGRYEPVIMKDDKIQIIISGPDKVVVSPYNFTLFNVSANGGGANGGQGASSVIPYLVDSNGCIEIPGIGVLKVEGMRRDDLVNKITSILKDNGLVRDPVVSVSFLNYKITVLGEVRSPGTYVMDSERTTILQAIGRAGDLLVTAKRDAVLLIREVDGVQTHVKIDLTGSDILSSPYFYLHQNDVIYVPQSTKGITFDSANTGVWSILLSSITTLLSILTLVLNLIR